MHMYASNQTEISSSGTTWIALATTVTHIRVDRRARMSRFENRKPKVGFAVEKKQNRHPTWFCSVGVCPLSPALIMPIDTLLSRHNEVGTAAVSASRGRYYSSTSNLVSLSVSLVVRVILWSGWAGTVGGEIPGLYHC